jgi:hypothetical protein
MKAQCVSPIAALALVFAAGCSGKTSDATSAPEAGTDGHTSSSFEPQLPRPLAHGAGSAEPLICQYADAGWGGRTASTAALPQFVLYGDGLLVFGPPVPYSYQMKQARVTEAGIQFLVGRLDDLGLFAADIRLSDEGVADAAWSTLRLVAADHDRRHTVYPAGDFGETASGQALQQGYAAVDFASLPNETIVEPPRPMEYSRVSLRVRLSSDRCEKAAVWPLAAPPALEPSKEETCMDLDRETALPFEPVEPGFDRIPMRAGDTCLKVTYRPVLPHEVACAYGQPSGCGF